MGRPKIFKELENYYKDKNIVTEKPSSHVKISYLGNRLIHYIRKFTVAKAVKYEEYWYKYTEHGYNYYIITSDIEFCIGKNKYIYPDEI